MTPSSFDLEAAIAEAHLPALLMSLVHMTGDAGLLTPERRAVYDPMAEPNLGGYSQETQADIRSRAKVAIEAFLAGAAIPPEPSRETIRKMMDYVAGADIPEHYVEFLTEELGIGGAWTPRRCDGRARR